MPWTLKFFHSISSDYGQIIHIARIDNFAFDHYEKQIVFFNITHLYYYAIIFRHS